jgi:hypothetical protein
MQRLALLQFSSGHVMSVAIGQVAVDLLTSFILYLQLS